MVNDKTLKVSLDDTRLIQALDITYPRLDIRSSSSSDFKLSEREIFFKLGQRAVVEMLIDKLIKLKKGEQ